MTATLDNALIRFGITSALARQQFAAHAAMLELPKNQPVFLEGKKNTSEYLLVSGIAHRYNLSEKGDMVTTGFYVAETVITPHFARTNNGKSLFSLQVLTDSVLAEIPVAALDQLRNNNPEMHDFGQRVLENELVKAVLLEISFRSYSAKERLLVLRRQYPNLEKLVPHNIIASYLGITNVSFSRLRKALTRE